MTDEASKVLDEHAQRRRRFLKTAGTAATVAPAVAVLLSGASLPAQALDGYQPPGTPLPPGGE